MDGLDLSAIDQLDQDVFNRSPAESDEDEEGLPLPDCIGIDSAVQDQEESRLRSIETRQSSSKKSRLETERELELNILRPDSIRRQILERSLNDGNNNGNHQPGASSSSGSTLAKPKNNRSHVMNIIEKAGMSGIDKERINQVIHEASKGSLFYKKQAQRQAEIHKSIENMLNRVKSATPEQVQNAKLTCDRLIEELERQRVFNRIIVHFDLDMFFAAVEIRDNPELKEKPVAVGGDSMVSTSNYIARRFGVRAAMPGFIAKKLCPELLLIKPNGFKYRQASSEVFSILELYDQELTSMSLDEAYLDLTDYVKNTLERDNIEHQDYYDGTLPKVWWTRASEIVSEIRQAIFDKTKLTCSAGIACNTLIAKISTDINKPDGQFMVEGYPKDVMDFISKTPVEKVSGIGKVSSQFLNALEIKTCGDILEKRHFLPLVFYEINVKFYLRVAFGDGSTSMKSDEQRKSKSVERTFSAVKDTLVLLDKLDSICEELCTKYLKPYRIKGRTVTVKLKRNTFTTTTKSYSMLVATNDKLVIHSAAKNLLLSEIANEPPEISYRLLGVRLSNLADDGVNTNQLTIDAMLRNQQLNRATKSENTVHRIEGAIDNKIASDELSLNAELITQEESVSISDVAMSQSPDNRVAQVCSPDISQKKSRLANTRIDSFFRKRMKDSDQRPRQGSSVDIDQKSDPFFSQEDDEEFFDAGSHHDLDSGPNEMSQEEQQQNRAHDEDFQCPYCFKPYSDFDALELHVDYCYLKTPIDVNKSFFSQRSQISVSPTNSFFSQVHRSSRSKLTTNSGKKGKAKRQPTTSASSSQLPLTSTRPATSENATKLSFYQKFIESNSHSLSQSIKLEPFQCPYCHHGFLNFSTLETHVIMCTKQKSN